MKHWTYHLDEVGAITREGDNQEYALMKIQSLKAEIEELQKKYDKKEEALTELASKDWTRQEIKKAKEDANLKPFEIE